MKRKFVGVGCLFTAACGGIDLDLPEPMGTTEAGPSDGSTGTDSAPEWPRAVGPCDLDPPEPTRLVVTTTDFGTGAVSVVDLARGTVETDVALASTDAIPVAIGDYVYVVNRHQFDYIDVLDPEADWISVGEHPVSYADVPSANPKGLALGPDGRAYVPLFAAPAVAVLDLNLPPGDSMVDTISLEPFADADGTPEASHIIGCGDTLFVSLERLDRNAVFAPLDGDRIVALDTKAGAAYGLQVPILGEFIKQFRRDPGDPDGHTVLALTTGIERIDLETREVSWAVPEDAFRAVGIDHRWLPQAFDVDANGTTAYLAAYDPDFNGVRLFRVGLDGRAPPELEQIAEGFDSSERTLEVVGDRLWYGSTRSGARGIWSFDLSAEPPVAVAGPLSTGLPPYSIAALP